jgi:hypothetical protein
MTLLRVLAVTEPGKQTWFWVAADVVVGVLLLLNVLVLVHARRLRLASRRQREERFRARLEQLLAEDDVSARSAASRPASAHAPPATPFGAARSRAPRRSPVPAR